MIISASRIVFGSLRKPTAIALPIPLDSGNFRSILTAFYFNVSVKGP